MSVPEELKPSIAYFETIRFGLAAILERFGVEGVKCNLLKCDIHNATFQLIYMDKNQKLSVEKSAENKDSHLLLNDADQTIREAMVTDNFVSKEEIGSWYKVISGK